MQSWPSPQGVARRYERRRERHHGRAVEIASNGPISSVYSVRPSVNREPLNVPTGKGPLCWNVHVDGLAPFAVRGRGEDEVLARLRPYMADHGYDPRDWWLVAGVCRGG